MSNEQKDQFVTDAKDQIVSEQESTKTEETTNETDVVKYATHKKLLNQLKNKSEELEELRRFKEEIEETEAKKKGDYEALLKAREEKIQSLSSKLESYETNLREGQKLQAFMDNLPGKIKKQDYLSFVNLDEIALDPETNRVDETSLKIAVDKFVQEYPDLIEAKGKNSLPKVASLGGRPNVKRSLKEMSREELRQAYLSGQFKQ